jgi:asparagine synthase (glutamine-hydrolysing)
MCGIAGIFNLNRSPASEGITTKMMAAMKHRGPNDEGTFSLEHICIGQVRLSIIDLSASGHQPMFSNDGRYAIVFNGEIYNYIELRDELKTKYNFKTNSDTEVILAAYTIWGEKCLDRFNGMWAFAILDTKDRSLFISRDRYGVKPLYYYQDNETFIFSSEIKSLYHILKPKLSADNNSVYEYLVYSRTDQTCNTFINEIKRVQHGYTVLLKDDKIAFKQWYNLSQKLSDPWKSPEEFRETFSSSVALRLRSDVPLGVCLSGGLDSSAVTSTILKDHGKNDLFAFSAVYGEGKHGDESKFIREYSSLPNLKYIHPSEQTFVEDISSFMDCHFEPVHTMSIYSQFKVLKEASKFVTVAMDGQGADEQLGGYHYFFSSYFLELVKQFRFLKFMKEASSYYKHHHSLFALKYMMFYASPAFIKDYAGAKMSGSISKDFYQSAHKNSNLGKLLFDPRSLNQSLLQHFEYKLEHNLKWNDLNSMYFSVELREPFLDYRLVERTLASPPDQKIRNGYTKWILRESMKGILPESIRLRQDKIGFDNPSDEWLRTPKFKELVFDALNSKALKDSGYLDVNECKKRYEKHLRNEITISKEIWKWVHLAHFLTKFN